MNWKIWSLTLFGILMGFLSVFGIERKILWILWIIIAVISGALIAKNADRQIFTKGAVVGLFDWIFFAIIQAVMFNTYLKNNPDSLDGFKEIPIAMEPQYVILFSGPFAGIIYGLFIGLLTFMFDKITGKRIQK
jgi:hypothetical protein